MSVKRLRLFAGPNGSGKTTILNDLKSEIPVGIVVNADEIEKHLKVAGVLFFDSFGITVEEKELRLFFEKSTFSPVKRNEPLLWEKISVKDNVLKVEGEVDSYLSADLADFIRITLLNNGLSFTFESVMSHSSKLDFVQKAKENGYRIYLYFSATEDPLINVNRVAIRVKQHGHFVEEVKIVDRYYRTLELLKSAIKLSDRAYIWDNSGKAAVLFAEITSGSDIQFHDEIPFWFYDNVMNDIDEPRTPY